MVFAIVFSPNKVLFAGLACGLCRNLLLEGFGLQLWGRRQSLRSPDLKRNHEILHLTAANLRAGVLDLRKPSSLKLATCAIRRFPSSSSRPGCRALPLRA